MHKERMFNLSLSLSRGSHCSFYLQVLGVDYAARFIDAAQKLKNGKALSYKAGNGEQKTAVMSGDYQPDRAIFKQVIHYFYFFFICNDMS